MSDDHPILLQITSDENLRACYDRRGDPGPGIDWNRIERRFTGRHKGQQWTLQRRKKKLRAMERR